MKGNRQVGHTLFETLVVLLVMSIVGLICWSQFLAIKNADKYKVQKTTQNIRLVAEGRRTDALAGVGDQDARTFDPASPIHLEAGVVFGGREYDGDLPFRAPRLTGPVVFEEQSGRTAGKVFGFIVFHSRDKKIEHAVYLPHIPGPMVLYIRRGGSGPWTRAQTVLY